MPAMFQIRSELTSLFKAFGQTEVTRVEHEMGRFLKIYSDIYDTSLE